MEFQSIFFFLSVNTGDYIQAVCDRNVAENISRVLYPNDNVSLSSVYLQTIFSTNTTFNQLVN